MQLSQFENPDPDFHESDESDPDQKQRYRGIAGTHLLWTVDDEISAGVEGTLVQLCQISVCHAVEQTVRGTQHDRDFTCKK